MDKSIREKWIDQKAEPSVSNFKLKRFTTNIDPKTSTKRGDKPFMSGSASVTATEKQ
jgi:hypothetical protein